MHRVQAEVKRRILKLTGLELIQDRKSSILSVKVPVKLYQWNSTRYSKINEKCVLQYKNVISLWYYDPSKQLVTAKKSKPSVTTTSLIVFMSNLLWSQTFKNLRKKKKNQDWRKVMVEKRELSPSMGKQTCTFFL